MVKIVRDGTDRSSTMKNYVVISVFAFLVACGIMFVLYKIFSYAPFGENYLASMDAYYQYLDFFAYLKDILSGNNEIGYTFGKTLGGNNVAVFSYYLTSPFNFLVVFFDKAYLHIFFQLLIVLKIGASAAAFCWFLRGRFHGMLQPGLVLLLSVSYALSQYNIAQSSNIMWLDGVYMLPFILLGVYKLVREKKVAFLSVSVGLCIVFNWYSGGMNCLFSILWFLFEMAYYLLDGSSCSWKKRIQTIIMTGIRYVIAMILGVLLSAALFWPTVKALQGGRASFDWQLLTNTFAGQIQSVIQGNTLGAISEAGRVSLFCGSLAVIGCICFFLSDKIRVKKKIITGILLIVTVLLFYWQPFIAAFSLMKSVGSYWYRYSYVGIFVVLFIAACFYKECRESKALNRNILLVSIGFSVVLLGLNYIYPLYSLKRTGGTIVFLLVIAIMLLCYLKCRGKKAQYVSVLLLGACLLVELSANAKLLMDYYKRDDGEAYVSYVTEEQRQISELRDWDDGIYRTSQTATRDQNPNGLTANYNEGLAYNYWSISGYTSDPDYNQMDFLNKLGYRLNGEVFCVVNTSIISADALLGVKYVLADEEIRGLEQVEELEAHNGKKVYENPYSLPFVFSYAGQDAEAELEGVNPFEYQNALYSQLAGEKAEIYSAIEYESIGNNEGYVYQLDIPEGNYAIYGNLCWGNETNAVLDVNGAYETAYAQWLSPSVFYVPVKENEHQATVTLTSAEYLAVQDVQFYALDLDRLAEVTEKIKSREAKTLTIENGYLKCEIEAFEGESAYLSVPFDEGWTILLNGKEVEPDLFGDCMISIPLEAGENTIEMTYRAAGVTTGIIMTCISIPLMVLVEVWNRRKSSKTGS